MDLLPHRSDNNESTIKCQSGFPSQKQKALQNVFAPEGSISKTVMA